MDRRESVPSRRFLLREKIGDTERSYRLHLGVNRLGSSASNHVVLSSTAVSRRHALLIVEPTSVTLEDLASKNGSVVNGKPVLNAVLRPGDELLLGDVRLWLAEEDPDEGRLAIAFSPRAAPPPQEQETSSYGFARQRNAEEVTLRLVARILDELDRASPPNLSRALEILVQRLALQGAMVCERGEGREVVVLAAAGKVEDPELDEGLWQISASGPPPAREGEVCCRVDATIEPSAARAILSRQGARPLAMVLFGPYADAGTKALLEVLIRILEGARPHPPAPESPRWVAELVFPTEFVPGVAPATKALYRQLGLLTKSDLPVLIRGETGVGKELVARILHDSSSRRQGPLIAINCAAIPAELLEAELFGVAKGVATGVSPRRGRFAEAQDGTLFLDEIADMPPSLQAKLLRALQEKKIQPVGGPATAIDVRFLAATNMDLQAKLETGAFRRDLYYRLAGSVVEVPPLRHRREDIPGLVEHFVRKFSREEGTSVRGITVKAIRILIDYPWPGNVRELEHEVRRLVHMCAVGQAIDPPLISSGIRQAAAEAATAPAGDSSLNLAAAEKRMIVEALARCDGHQRQAATLLGISRYSLRRRLRQHGLTSETD